MALPTSKSFLTKLEDLVAESEYSIRYAKGTFKSNACIVKDQKVIMLNGFLSTDGRINALASLLTGADFDTSALSNNALTALQQLKAKM